MLFLENSDLDISVKVYLCHPNACCCPSVKNVKVYITKTIPLEENANLISDTFGRTSASSIP